MPSVSNTAGPYCKFLAPRFTNNAKITTVDNLMVARTNYLIMFWDNSGYSLARKYAVQPAPSLSNILLVLI